MPNYGPMGWDDDQEWDDYSFAGVSDDSDGYTIWSPEDPPPYYSKTMAQRRSYRSALGSMASTISPFLSTKGDEFTPGTVFAEARGPSGYGTDYEPASLGWTKWGSYQPRARVGLGVWGHDKGLSNPFPILGGAIITPTIDIYTAEREQQFDQHGRALDEREYRTSSGLTSGHAYVGEIMQKAGAWGRAKMDTLIAQGVPFEEARMMAERAARQSVREQIEIFPREDFGEQWSWPRGLREAMKSAANIRLHGDYGVGPRDLFEQLGKYEGGFFTRSTSPSEDEFHPERGSWEAYSLDSLYALGWFKSPDGGFITGTDKPPKRRQLGVQRLASPIADDDLLRTGRLSGDRMLNTTAVFVENYAYSEGSGVADPTLVRGFKDFRPKTIERPAQADDSWQVRFRDIGGMGRPGESVSLGEQFLNGEWQTLGDEPGSPGVRKRLAGYRKTKSGYQALIESDSPFESGTAKLMHHGMKALLFQSTSIIDRMQRTVSSAQAAGMLPGDVAAPRMVLPMSKDWLQTYQGMFDFLPEETLRGMGVSSEAIQSKDWQKVGPGVVDKLSKYIQDRRFTFQQQYEIPVSRLGAFENAGNIVGGKGAVEYLTKGGEQFARFNAEHTGYAIPIAAGIRMEYPGHSPMYSPEELMQMRRQYPRLAERLAGKANPASRIWGAAVASAEGTVPQGAVSHEELPWLSAHLNMEGSFDDEGGSRKLVENLAREMREREQLGAIIGPGGTLLPNPNDVLSQSIMGYTGQEQSQFVSSYIRAMKLMGTGEDATKALEDFSGSLQTFAAGHNVRRKALGATLDRAVEGTFTSHLAIPDEMVVAGNDALRTLLGIRSDDKDGDAKFAEAVRMIERGDGFHALGTRRPVSDMFNQLGVSTKVITEKMAQEIYGVEIENLGRSFAVSPTLAAVWRGDVDADRALLQGVTDVKYKGMEVHMPGGNETWYTGGVYFNTSSEILDAFNSESMMSRQVKALRTRAPDAFKEWIGGVSAKDQKLVEAGLGGDRSVDATRALSRALHGIPVDWNESAKWSEELAMNTGKNLPQNFAYYADPANGTVFSREKMLGKFEQTAKSKMLMGRGYNRYLRGLTSMAGNEEELQAAVTLASNVYQKALDNQKMTKGELMLFNMMESMGPSGAVHDKFYTERGYVSKGSAFTGGPIGMTALLAQSITDMDMPREALATLFSRDPAIAAAVAGGGDTLDILRAIGMGGREYENTIGFLQNPERAGILPQLVQAMHYSKDSIKPMSDAEKAYAAQGHRIRAMTRVVSRAGEGLAPGAAAEDMRNMAGLDSLGWWKRNMAKRMGLNAMFFASDEEVMSRMPSLANPALPGEEFPAFISQKEANVLEGLRQMPIGQAQQIAAAISRPARYTPKGDTPSFDTGPAGWDKFNKDQQNELKRMFRHGAPDDEITSRMKDFLAQMEAEPGSGASVSSPDPIPGTDPIDDSDPFAGAPLPYAADLSGGNQTRTMKDGTVVEAKIPRSKRAFKLHENPEVAKLREAVEIWKAGEKVDISSAPGMLSFVQAMGRASGKHLKINMNAYTSGAWSATAQLEDPGLKGHAQAVLLKLMEKGPAEGYTPEVMRAMEDGFTHSGLGQDMMRAVRGIIDADPATLDTKEQWRLWEQIQKVRGAMGQDTPLDGAFAKKVEDLSAIMAKSADPSMSAGAGVADKFSPETLQSVRSLLTDSLLGRFIGGPGNIEDVQALAEGGMTSTLNRLRRISAGAGDKIADSGFDNTTAQRFFADKAKAIEEIASEFGWNALGDDKSDIELLKNRHLSALDNAESFDGAIRREGVAKKARKDAKERRLNAREEGTKRSVFGAMFGDSDDYRGGLVDTVLAGGAKEFESLMSIAALDDINESTTPKEREKILRSAFKATGSLHGSVGENSATQIFLQNKGEEIFEQWTAAKKDLLEATLKETEARKASQKTIEEEVKVRGDYLKSPQGQAQLKGMETFVSKMSQQMGGTGGAPWTPEGVKTFSPAEVKHMQTAMNAYKSMGTPEGDEKAKEIANTLDRDEFAKSMEEFGKEPGIIGKAMNKVLKRPAGTPGMGSADVGNMFTELTLGWTAFRMRMAWNLTTGAQKDWQDAFMNQEAAAASAALAGGAPAGIVGNSSQYLAANAAIANSKAQLGQGVAQVYAPLMSGVAGVNASPGLGAAATIGGTALGASFLAAMGADMIGGVAGMGAVGAAAGPIGLVAGLGVAGALGTSYVAGEGPAWVKQKDGSYSQDWRMAARARELMDADKPGWIKALNAASAGVGGAMKSALGLDPLTSLGVDQATRDKLVAEKATYVPGMLAKDADALRDWTSNRFGNTVNVDQMLQIEGALFPLTGTTAQQLYENKSPQVEKLLGYFGSYLQSGASPDSLFSSQMATAQAAGVPLGPATLDFMVRFGDRFANGGSEQRAMYEQAYQGLSAIPRALGRQTSDAESELAVKLTGKYGNEERAANEVTGLLGVGWFTSTFGVKSGSLTAQNIGKVFGAQDLPTQNVSQQIAGMTASSFIRGGVQTEDAAKMIASYAETNTADKVLGFSNLVIQAESVSLRTGMSMATLVNDAWGKGYDQRSIADQSWFTSSRGGVSGLAPSSMLPGSAQAQAFEQPYEELSIPQQTAYKTAAGMLTQVMPRGYSPAMLEQYGNQLFGGANVADVGLTLQAQTGRAGLATAFGIPAASPFAKVLEMETIGQLNTNVSTPTQQSVFMSQLTGAGTGLNMTGDQIRGMGSMINSSLFQHMSPGQIAKLAPGLRDAYKDYENDKLTYHQFSRIQENATGSTPWGMSSQLGFGPGSLTDSLGRPYGMYEPWTATAGRQSGQSFAPLFDLQMNAAYAGLAAQSAALPIEHRTFQRQQAAQRMQWGTGPFVEQSKVQAAIFPEPGSGIEPAQVGLGMQVGDSTIGLAQQEAAIRKQMWQENLAYQQQSIGFQRQSLEIARQEFELSKRQYGAQREYNLNERSANRGMQMQQREWATEDFSIRSERMGINQQWAMEDLQRARRYSTGRERVDIERNIQRTMLTQGWERDDSNRGRNRELEVQRFQDQRYDAAVKFEQKLHELQVQRFALQEQKFGIQEAQLAAQEAHLNNQAALQEKLQKIDEDRFKFQYEQTQAQMKDDETLEKLRQEVRKAEIAYQTAQLANAETLAKSQEEWQRRLEKGKTEGVLDKWIEFFNTIFKGPPGYIPPAGPTGGIDPTGGQQQEVKPNRFAEAGVGRELTGTKQPQVINFVLDGEVVFSAVVKPERLRPVVEEINRRGKLR